MEYAYQAIICFHIQSFLPSCLVEYIGEMAFAAVLTIVHGSHEDTSSALYPELASIPIGTVRSVILPQRLDILSSSARSCHLRPPCSI